MRIAITLPSIDPRALVARQLDAVVRALTERVDVEVFAESMRLRKGELAAPAFHYLRFDERHEHKGFDTALYPFGRDFLPYEPSYLLAGRFAGVAWILDPAMHHMLLGALGLQGRWDAYIEVLESTVPMRGGRVGAAVAGGWGTRALYDHYDPLVRALSQRHRMLAATVPIAAQMRRQGVEAAHVELPVAAETLGASSDGSRTKGVVAVVSASSRWPQPLMSGLARLLAKRPELTIRYATPEVIYHAVAGPAALRAGLEGRIEWHLSPSPAGLLEVADGAEFVVAVAPEPVAYERAVLYRALASGSLTLVADAPHYGFVPRDIAPRLAPGRAVGQALFVTVDSLLDDAALVAGLQDAGRSLVATGADAAFVAESVQTELERARDDCAPPSRRSEATWELLRERLQRRCEPSNATSTACDLIRACLARVAPRAIGMTIDA
ncbi:MAG TPA: hypothetical protein QGG47_12550 [Acidobacteriota bacterium]|nr:hypothetical protein [Acidobacteriota bacterium]